MAKQIGILLTSHPGHTLFLKLCLDCFVPLKDKYEIVLGWDDDDFRYHYPLPDGINLMLTGVPRPPTFGCRLHLGERWQMRKGAEFLANKGCEYMLKLGGDQIVNHPENIPILIERLGDGDILAPVGHHPAWLQTNTYFVRLKNFVKAVELSEQFDTGYCETIYMRMVTEGLLKWTPIDDYPEYERFLGRRHLQSEYNHATGKFYEASWKAGSEPRDLTIEELDKLMGR